MCTHARFTGSYFVGKNGANGSRVKRTMRASVIVARTPHDSYFVTVFWSFDFHSSIAVVLPVNLVTQSSVSCTNNVYCLSFVIERFFLSMFYLRHLLGYYCRFCGLSGYYMTIVEWFHFGETFILSH